MLRTPGTFTVVITVILMHVIVPYMYINETGSVLQNQELQKQMNLVVSSKL